MVLGQLERYEKLIWNLISTEVPLFCFVYLYSGYHDPNYIAFMKKNYPPGFSYPEFGPMFTAEFFEPLQWADILKSSGAR